MIVPYDREAFTTAWGANRPVIVGGVRDEFKLPLLPPSYTWSLTRMVTTGVVKEQMVHYPTYLLKLIRILDQGHEVVRQGKIDKSMYGEAGVVELARDIRERHCPARR